MSTPRRPAPRSMGAPMRRTRFVPVLFEIVAIALGPGEGEGGRRPPRPPVARSVTAGREPGQGAPFSISLTAARGPALARARTECDFLRAVPLPFRSVGLL